MKPSLLFYYALEQPQGKKKPTKIKLLNVVSNFN